MEKNEYTTGEVAKVLGVSFRTVKRWIYSGKIKCYTKTIGGHYRIPKEEIERLKSEVEDQHATDVIKLIRQRKVAFFREIQISLEDDYRHYETRDKLKWLVDQRRINSKLELGHRWYFPVDVDWTDVKEVAEKKADLVKFFVDYDRKFEQNGIKYQEYSEYLVEHAMIRAGYTVVAKDTYYFNGVACVLRRGVGRPPDLDFVAQLPSGIYVGVQVKNRLEYPKSDDVNTFIELCRRLNLRPLLVTRQCHPMTFDVVKRLKGRVVVFKQSLLKPGFPRDKLEALRREVGFPLGVYRWPPDYLIKKLEEAAKAIS